MIKFGPSSKPSPCSLHPYWFMFIGYVFQGMIPPCPEKIPEHAGGRPEHLLVSQGQLSVADCDLWTESPVTDCPSGVSLAYAHAFLNVSFQTKCLKQISTIYNEKSHRKSRFSVSFAGCGMEGGCIPGNHGPKFLQGSCGEGLDLGPLVPHGPPLTSLGSWELFRSPSA